mmetsp:Transcript_6451/g.18272  ORF Transcript_6451/g.18272 Transcript_6451/m.18272 type:complete len:552 (-) Transcript_6451:193-1848(-)
MEARRIRGRALVVRECGCGAAARRRPPRTSARLRAALCLGLGMGFLSLAGAQYRPGSDKYNETMEEISEGLEYDIKTSEYVVRSHYPELLYPERDQYRYAPVSRADYVVGLIIDPCVGLEHDCCMDTFGTPQYLQLKGSTELSYGDDIHSLTQEVTENGDRLPLAASRRPDDYVLIDETCVGEEDPHSLCIGPLARSAPSDAKPACSDNNATVNALASCLDVAGEEHETCVQVGYSSTSFITQCGNEFTDDPHCGTFLEVHKPKGTFHDPEELVLAEVRLTTESVSGYNTTTLPLHYSPETNDSPYRRVLCNFLDTKIAIGQDWRVAETAPKCCCPYAFRSTDRTGRYMCPRDRSSSLMGPFWGAEDTYYNNRRQELNFDSFPRCPVMDMATDKMYMGDLVTLPDGTTLAYHRPATQDDLSGTYAETCPYFDACGMVDADQSCQGTDQEYDFRGEHGIVSAIHDVEGRTVGVDLSFNNGRTSYYFAVAELEDEQIDMGYNYELWWVERTPSEFVVRKKKPFRIEEPACTFDLTNDRYFPYALITEDGVAID